MGGQNRYCGHCGVELPLEARFCGHCGTSQLSWEELQLQTEGRTRDTAPSAPSRSRFGFGLAPKAALLVAFCLLGFIGFRCWTDAEQESIRYQLLKEGELTAEEPILSAEGVSLRVEPAFLDTPVRASLKKADSFRQNGLEIELYDISADFGDETEPVLIEIQLPYDPEKVPDGQAPEETLAVVEFNAATSVWESPDVTLDSQAQRLLYKTTHLSEQIVFYANRNLDLAPNSNIGISGESANITISPSLPPVPYRAATRNGTVDIDFSVFQIRNFSGPEEERRLMDYITGWDKEALLDRMERTDPEYKRFSKMEAPGEMTTYMMRTLGLNTGVVEYTTRILADGSKSGFLGATSSVFSNAGFIVSTAQFLQNVNDGTSLSQAGWGYFKGFVYFKGGELLAAKLGVRALGVYGLIGLWTFEQFFYPVENIFDFTAGKEFYKHKRYYGAMTDYLAATDQRKEKDWYEVVKRVHQTVTESISEGTEPAAYFKQVMDDEIAGYCQKFFKSDTYTQKKYLLETSSGYLYGDNDRIHYKFTLTGDMTILDYKREIMKLANSDSSYNTAEFGNLIYYDNTRTTGTLSEQTNKDNADWYLDRFADNSRLQSELTDRYRNEVYETYINTHLNTVLAIEQNILWKKANDSMDELVDELNDVVTIRFKDPGYDGTGISAYSGHYLVPNVENYRDWKIRIDDSGQAATQFTRIEYLRNGNFKQYNLYKPTDGADEMIIASPVAVLNLDLSSADILVTLKGLQTKKKKINVSLDARESTVTVGESAVFQINGETGGYDFLWNFGDASEPFQGEAYEYHRYDKSGSYTVSVTLYKNNAAVGEIKEQITVVEPDKSPPFASIEGTWLRKEDGTVYYKVEIDSGSIAFVYKDRTLTFYGSGSPGVISPVMESEGYRFDYSSVGTEYRNPSTEDESYDIPGHMELNYIPRQNRLRVQNHEPNSYAAIGDGAIMLDK